MTEAIPEVHEGSIQVVVEVDGADHSSVEIVLGGPRGEKGDVGPTGPSGAGIPAGGEAGQLLQKVDGSDFNTAWATPASNGYANSSYSFIKRGSTSTSSILPRVIIPLNVADETLGADILWTSANPTRLTAASDGLYRLGGVATVHSTADRAQAVAEIFKNGVTTGMFRSTGYIRNNGISWDYWALEIANTPFILQAGDYLEVAVVTMANSESNYVQGNGGGLSLLGSGTSIWMERVA
ncbi:MAG: hypothetical protein AAF618_08140 [Pseudomonadota bacterium]